MNVAMMQPTFLPWQGYFGPIAAADIFVFLDDFQFSPRSWHQRNVLFTNKGTVGWYTVPVRTGGVFPLALDRVGVDPSRVWREKMWKRLEQNYGRAPHYRDFAAPLHDWLFSEPDSLAAFDIAFIRFACDALGIETELRLSSEHPSDAVRSNRVLELLDWCGASRYYAARGSFDYMQADAVFPVDHIESVFADFRPEPHRQVGSPAEFVPQLSVLDALLNVGAEETARLVGLGTRAWLSWDERRARSSG